jgi:hypothetical protein
MAGIVLGITVLVRSTLLLFPLFVFAYLATNDRRAGKGIMKSATNALVMTSAMAIFMLPWIARNHSLVDRLVPTTSVQGIAAHAGLYICKNLTFRTGMQQLDRAAARERTQIATDLGLVHSGRYYRYFNETSDELIFSNFLLRSVIHEYSTNPTLFARCVARNTLNFWFAGKDWRSTAFNVIVQLPLLFLAAVGARRALQSNHNAVLDVTLLLVVYLMALHVPILAQARYSVPLIPYLSILASFGVFGLCNRVESGRRYAQDP